MLLFGRSEYFEYRMPNDVFMGNAFICKAQFSIEKTEKNGSVSGSVEN